MASTTDSSGLKTYEARFVREPGIIIDGDGDEPAWEKAVPQGDFFFPWTEREPPLTEFRALHDGRSLYFLFRVDEDDIVSVEDFQRFVEPMVHVGRELTSEAGYYHMPIQLWAVSREL